MFHFQCHTKCESNGSVYHYVLNNHCFLATDKKWLSFARPTLIKCIIFHIRHTHTELLPTFDYNSLKPGMLGNIEGHVIFAQHPTIQTHKDNGSTMTQVPHTSCTLSNKVNLSKNKILPSRPQHQYCCLAVHCLIN